MLDKIKKGLIKIKKYIQTNILMVTFVVTSLINGCLVRHFTVANPLDIKPMLADLVFLLIITSFGYFLKPKNQFKYFIIFSVVLSAICIINTVYYSNYLSFASVSLLKTASELGGYTDAVFENILDLYIFN